DRHQVLAAETALEDRLLGVGRVDEADRPAAGGEAPGGGLVAIVAARGAAQELEAARAVLAAADVVGVEDVQAVGVPVVARMGPYGAVEDRAGRRLPGARGDRPERRAEEEGPGAEPGE